MIINMLLLVCDFILLTRVCCLRRSKQEGYYYLVEVDGGWSWVGGRGMSSTQARAGAIPRPPPSLLAQHNLTQLTKRKPGFTQITGR